MWHGAARSLDVADEVDAGQPLPDGALGGGIEPGHLEHEDRVVRAHLIPLGLGSIDRIAASLAIDLEDRAVFDAVRGALPLRVVEQVVAPSRVASRHGAWRSDADGLVDRGEESGGFVILDQSDPAERYRRLVEREPRTLDVERALEGPHPEPEMLVDRAFGRPQHGQRLVALARLLEEPAHHLPEDPAPPMARRHGDHGDPGGADRSSTGHGHIERIRAARPDPPVTIDRADQPIELPEASLEVELGVAEGLGECFAGRLDERADLVRAWLPQADRVICHPRILPCGPDSSVRPPEAPARPSGR